MSKNMSTLDRRVRAALVAPVAVAIGLLIGPGSIVSMCCTRSRRSCSRPAPRATAPCIR